MDCGASGARLDDVGRRRLAVRPRAGGRGLGCARAGRGDGGRRRGLPEHPLRGRVRERPRARGRLVRLARQRGEPGHRRGAAGQCGDDARGARRRGGAAPLDADRHAADRAGAALLRLGRGELGERAEAGRPQDGALGVDQVARLLPAGQRHLADHQGVIAQFADELVAGAHAVCVVGRMSRTLSAAMALDVLDPFNVKRQLEGLERLRGSLALATDIGFLRNARRALLPLPLIDRDEPVRTDVFPPFARRPAPRLAGKRIAVVGSGGAGACAAMVGMARAFEEAGLRPAAISTCSGSTIWGAMWAAGLTADEMAEFSLAWRPQDYLDIQWARLPRFALSALRGFAG